MILGNITANDKSTLLSFIALILLKSGFNISLQKNTKFIAFKSHGAQVVTRLTPNYCTCSDIQSNPVYCFEICHPSTSVKQVMLTKLKLPFLSSGVAIRTPDRDKDMTLKLLRDIVRSLHKNLAFSVTQKTEKKRRLDEVRWQRIPVQNMAASIFGANVITTHES